ncbi:MAG: endonuclease/exonuclease/phosphatase family protein [Lutibacter sp.]
MLSFFNKFKKQKDVYTVAFYNLENLFDVNNNPNILDDDFTPNGKKHWNYKKYQKKLKKLGRVISELGTNESYYAPVIVGVVEVENDTVLNDLVNSKYLKKEHYGFVHYDSPDERGIDVALLYKKEFFELIHAETFPLYLEDEHGERDYTRDILLVKGKIKGELVHVIVNHWPSRRSGDDHGESKRVKASNLAKQIVQSLIDENSDSKIIIMGDFNDDPTNKSLKNLVTENFHNPMLSLLKNGKGSLRHDRIWHLFDQIIFTKNFFIPQTHQLSFKHARVFNPLFLREWHGKYKGNPFRTYVGKRYQGGFSDHFPVYVHLKRN